MADDRKSVAVDPGAALSSPTYGVAVPWPGSQRWRKPVFIAFLALFALNEALLLLRIELPVAWRWVEGLFMLSAMVSALVGLGCRLPLQNVVMTAAVVASLAGGILLVGVTTGVPFGPLVYGEGLGPMLFGVVPWTVLGMWVVWVVNGRGVARLMMRPWRKTNYYGYWVMGLTALLAVHFDLALEPFAVKVRHYWLWRPTTASLEWYGVPWVQFLGVFVTMLGILSLALPWLINKQPVKQPMDYQPLVQWGILHVWLMTGNALHGQWAACAVGGAGLALAAFYAVRGARW